MKRRGLRGMDGRGVAGPAAYPDLAESRSVTECELYRTLFDEAPIAYHELDESGTIRRINQAHCSLLGYSAEELVGKPIWMFAADQEQDLGRKAIARKLKGEEPLVPCYREYLTSRNEVLTVEVHSRLILSEDGRVLGIRTALIDRTARFAAEKALKDHQHWLSTTLDALGEGVVAVDPLGEIRFVNRTAEQLLGWSTAEAVRRDITDVLFVENLVVAGATCSLREILDKSLQAGQNASAQLRARGGELAQIEMKSSPIFTEDNRVAGSVLILRPCA